MAYQNSFFKKYIPEWQEIEWIIHEHIIVIVDKIILWSSFWAFIPSFLYYNSYKLQEVIPFYWLEWILLFTFLKIFYDVFNWYNDVWIITDDSIFDLEWSLLKTKVESIKYEHIEWIEIDKNRIWDTLFNKWNIVIHKFWDESLIIENAFSPYKAVDNIERYLHLEEEPAEDRFEVIMNTLGWVVEEYLDRKWIREEYDNPEKRKKKKYEPKVDDYTIDLR